MLNKILKFLFWLNDLNSQKNWNKSSHKSGDFNRKFWNLTSDPEGVIAKKPICCPICQEKMILRKSKLGRSRDLSYRNAVFDLEYKCIGCALCLSFGVAVPNLHFEFIRGRRQHLGVGRVYTPEQKWNDHDIVKKRLEQLGYW